MNQSYIGIDIGGTKIYSVAYDTTWQPLLTDKRPTDATANQAIILQNIVESLQAVWSDSVQSIGVSWAGFVDHQQGIIKHAPNISALSSYALTEYLSGIFNVPVWLENDAQLFAYAAAQASLAEQKNLVSLGIIIGTGVGAGLVINGQIFQGAQGMAAEVGHMLVGDQEIEAQIAGKAMQGFWQEQFGHHDFGQEADQLNHMTPVFQQVFKPKIQIFSRWLANLILAYNPHEIVFGGTTAQKIWRYFAAEIETQTRILLKPYPLEFQLRFSELENAGALGAAMMAKQKLGRANFLLETLEPI